MNQLEKALAYAKKGITVFPCSAKKAPLTENGFKDATTKAVQIKKWWDKNPDALIGSPNSNFTVIDVDDHNVCPAGAALTKIAISRLKADEVIGKREVRVTTMSGGTHYYFKQNDHVTRLIGCLPNIDLLANGGYVILPDQTNYICETSKTPWNDFGCLPLFDQTRFNMIVAEFEELSKHANQLKKAHKATYQPPVRASAEATVLKDPRVAKSRRELNNLPVVNQEEGHLKSHANTGYNKDGEYFFEESPELYKGSGKQYDFDYTKKLISDEPMFIKKNALTTEKIMELFHNHEVQMKLAKFLKIRNIPEPSGGAFGKSFRSLLPKHKDRKPSMSVRWSMDGSHLLVRDWSNHYGNKYNQLDYNIVSLYASIRHGAQMNRMSGNEFNMWFLRLLFEAKIITCELPKYKDEEAFENLPRVQKEVAESMLLLAGLRSLYRHLIDTSVTFSDRFGSAWSGACPKTVNKAKKQLVKMRLLFDAGSFNCGTKASSSFYMTKLYEVLCDDSFYLGEGVVCPTTLPPEELKEYKPSYGKLKPEKQVAYAYVARTVKGLVYMTTPIMEQIKAAMGEDNLRYKDLKTKMKRAYYYA